MSFSPGVSDPSGVIQEQRDRWGRKRSRVARELVQSEQRYCEQLELVNTVKLCFCALDVWGGGWREEKERGGDDDLGYFVDILKAKGTLRQSVLESVFSSIKAIHSVNQSLLVHVENGYFGRGFEQFCPQLHHYNCYVDNMYSARKILVTQLKKNKAFRRFKILQEGRPELHNCSLEDLLSLPAQRIQQYKHFLQDLTENTSPDDPDSFLFTGQHAYPLRECTVDKVFGHTKSRGGLLSLSFPKAKLLLMSCDQEDINDWHQSLVSANHLQLCRVQKLLKGRRTKANCEVTERAQTPASSSNGDGGHTTGPAAPKRMKLAGTPAGSPPEPSGSSCVIL
ncbi:LOW QUALITY PROTEIN: hypothetical protein CRUP_025842 [Coryphaenoides rupestris]|nr:LOW QUALITY PROTEIN: hypothetical protein CRUP_025842 [Coryphaenoides rupestris]